MKIVPVIAPHGTPVELARHLRLFADSINERIDEPRDIIVDNSSNGLILKSPNGHYWRVKVSDAGVLSTTDLGTSKP